MSVKREVLSDDRIRGFVSVENFKGHVTNVELDFVKQMLNVLDVLKATGFSEIEVGAENDGSLLFFTNEERTTAFAIAPLVKKGQK